MELGKAENVRYESPTDGITTVGLARLRRIEEATQGFVEGRWDFEALCDELRRVQGGGGSPPPSGFPRRPPEPTCTAGVEQSPSQVPALPPPYLSPADEFGQHFFRCFFCRIGDNRIEDHFCKTGRELIVAMLDELDGRP